MKYPKVSIIIPTYNRLSLIKITLDSILSQSFTNFEIIIIDDGSTDGTQAAIMAHADRRLRYVYQENAGEASATNHGWRLANGQYIAVVSSDDPVLPGWLDTMVNVMDADPTLLVGYPDWRIIDINGNTLQTLVTNEYTFARMVSWFCTLPGPGALIRKSALAGFGDLRDTRYRYVPDLESWLRLGLVGPFARVPHELASWRSHPTSISVADRSRTRAQEMVRLARTFMSRPDIPADIRHLKPFMLSRAYWLASWTISETHPLLSDYYLLQSYRLAKEDPPELPSGLRRWPRPQRSQILEHLRNALTPSGIGEKPKK